MSHYNLIINVCIRINIQFTIKIIRVIIKFLISK